MNNTLYKKWKDKTNFVTETDFEILEQWKIEMSKLSKSEQGKELQAVIDIESLIANANTGFLPLQPLGAFNLGTYLSQTALEEFASNHKELEILFIKRCILGELIHSKNNH